MADHSPPPDWLDSLPAPDLVRHGLAVATRRRELLKRLLKLSQYAAAYPTPPLPPTPPSDGKEGDHV